MRDSAFDEFSAREPYFAVLTHPKFLRANLTPAREREFFGTGEALVDWMFAIIEAGLVPGFAPVAMLSTAAAQVVWRFRSHDEPVQSRPSIDRRSCSISQGARPSGAALATSRSTRPTRSLRSPGSSTWSSAITCCSGSPGVRDCRWFETRRSDQSRRRRHVSVALRDGCVARDAVHTLGPRAPARRERNCQSPSQQAVRRSIHPDSRVCARPPAVGSEGGRLSGTHVVFEQSDGLDYAIAFARKPGGTVEFATTKPAASRTAARSAAVTATDPEIDAFNRAAETYYAILSNWDHHLAKPFSQIAETPAILANLAVILQGLKLSPGLCVLDFGAGTGWLSRWLTQLGCRVTLLDVSPTALAIAREHYARHPVIGSQPSPQFLVLDGRRSICLTRASIGSSALTRFITRQTRTR